MARRRRFARLRRASAVVHVLGRHAGRALPPVPEVEVAVAGRNERNTKVQGRDLVGIKGDADE